MAEHWVCYWVALMAYKKDVRKEVKLDENSAASTETQKVDETGYQKVGKTAILMVVLRADWMDDCLVERRVMQSDDPMDARMATKRVDTMGPH